MRNSDDMTLVKFLRLLKRMCENDTVLRESDKEPEEIILYGFDRLSQADKITVLKMVEISGDVHIRTSNELSSTIKIANTQLRQQISASMKKFLSFFMLSFILLLIAGIAFMMMAPALTALLVKMI